MTEVLENLIRLDLACNQNCLFCNVKENNELFVSAEEAKKQINKLNKDGKRINIVTFTGGEPTINNSLIELISYARGKGLSRIGIQTNAMMCSYQEYAKKLKNAGLTNAFIPLHSYSKEIFEEITRVPGSYEKSIRGIHNLAKERIQIVFNIVINSKNYKDLLSLISWAEKEFADVRTSNKKLGYRLIFSFSFVQPHGLARKNLFIIPRMSEVRPYIREAMEFCKSKGIGFNNPGCGFPLCFVKGYEEESLEYLAAMNKGIKDRLEKNRKSKTKGPQCKRCKLDDYCFGVWKAYANIYGTDELTPY